jgi:hypothetical protein
MSAADGAAKQFASHERFLHCERLSAAREIGLPTFDVGFATPAGAPLPRSSKVQQKRGNQSASNIDSQPAVGAV